MSPSVLAYLESALLELQASFIEMHNGEPDPVVQTHLGHVAELALLSSLTLAEAREHLEEKEALDS